LVGCSFGENTPSSVYNSNIAIAKIANSLEIPTIAQHEIGEYLVDKTYILRSYPKVGKPDVRGDKYVNSLQIALAALEICQQKGWNEIGILAQPDHQRLIYMIFKKRGVKAYIIDTTSVECSPKNNQLWVRWRWLFVLDSIATRIFFLLKGWI
jgi:hypothetical protein